MPIDFPTVHLEYTIQVSSNQQTEERRMPKLIFGKFRVGQQVRVNYKNSCGGGCWKGVGKVLRAYTRTTVEIKIIEVHGREDNRYPRVGMEWVLEPGEITPNSSVYSNLLKGSK